MNDFRFDSDWGVVQKFSLESDTKTSLVAAITIALTEHKSVESFVSTEESLIFCWSNNDIT